MSSPGSSVANLTEVVRLAQRERHAHALLCTSTQVLNSRREALELIDPQDQGTPDAVQVHEICEFFACEVFGGEGLTRLSAFLHMAREGAPFSRPSTGAEDANNSLSLLLSSYQTQSRIRDGTLVLRCLQFTHLTNFFKLFTEHLADVARPGTVTRNSLAELGLGPSQGHDWKSVLLNCLVSHQRNIDTHVAEQDIQARRMLLEDVNTASHIHFIGKIFGEGVFVLLPDASLRRYVLTVCPGKSVGRVLMSLIPRIATWRTRPLKVTIRNLRRNIPDTMQLCASLYKNVLEPLEENRLPPMLRVEQVRTSGAFRMFRSIDLVKPISQQYLRRTGIQSGNEG